MATPECRAARRLCTHWFLKCFGGNKYEQSLVGNQAVLCKEPERASQRETVAPEEPFATKGKKTRMVQRAARISWKKAKRLLSVHRLTEGCIPHHRSDAPVSVSREQGETKEEQEHPLTRIEIALEASPASNSENRRVTSGDETACIGRPDAQNRGKPHDTGYATNAGEMNSVLAGGHDRAVRAAGLEALPAPYEAYKDSFSSSIEECNSLCALGCQYGDDCSMKVHHHALSESELKNAPAGSDPKELVEGNEENASHGKSSATSSIDDIQDDANDASPEAGTGAGIDEMEYLTPHDSKPSSTDGSSHEDSPFCVFSPEKMEAIQEGFSTSIVETIEVERSVSRDKEITSNEFHSQTGTDEAQVRKSSPVSITSLPGDNLRFESIERVSSFVNDVEAGNKPSVPSVDSAPESNGEGENEVNQVLLGETEKVVVELSSPQDAESNTSRNKDVDIDVIPVGVHPETTSLRDPENLSCPHIPQLPHGRPDCSLDLDGTPASNDSLVVSNGMEASSGILHIRRPGSPMSGGFQYPPSIRAYRLQRRTERFQRYFEEFLETERLPHETVHAKSRMVNRVRRFFEDGSSDVVV